MSTYRSQQTWASAIKLKPYYYSLLSCYFVPTILFNSKTNILLVLARARHVLCIGATGSGSFAMHSVNFECTGTCLFCLFALVLYETSVFLVRSALIHPFLHFPFLNVFHLDLWDWTSLWQSGFVAAPPRSLQDLSRSLPQPFPLLYFYVRRSSLYSSKN